MKTEINSTSILENALLFSLTRRSWGNRGVADKSKIHTTNNPTSDEQQKKRLHLTKQLITECKELDALYDALAGIYQWCIGRSMYSCLRDGVYFVKKSMVEEFEAKIASANTAIEDELMPAFLKVYNEAIDRARDELGEMFNESDYPPIEEMRHKFGVQHSWLEVNVPKDLPKAVKAREEKKIKEQLQNAATEIVFALRESFASYVEDLARRMEVVPGTAGKRFTAPGAVENMRDFITRFNCINIANDTELQATVEKAKLILDGKDADNLVHSEMSRQRIKAALADIRLQTGKLIAERPKRKFREE